MLVVKFNEKYVHSDQDLNLGPFVQGGHGDKNRSSPLDRGTQGSSNLTNKRSFLTKQKANEPPHFKDFEREMSSVFVFFSNI